MPSSVRFAELKRRLEAHGWQLIRIKGSHHHFRGEGREPIGFPVHRGQVKAVYARQIEAAIQRIIDRED